MKSTLLLYCYFSMAILFFQSCCTKVDCLTTNSLSIDFEFNQVENDSIGFTQEEIDKTYVLLYSENDFTGQKDTILIQKDRYYRNLFGVQPENYKSFKVMIDKIGQYYISDIEIENIKVNVNSCNKCFPFNPQKDTKEQNISSFTFNGEKTTRKDPILLSKKNIKPFQE